MKIVISGQNPTSIFSAVILEQLGHDITLIDNGSGAHIAYPNPFEVMAIPSEAAAFDALAQLESALDLPLIDGEIQRSPIFFDGNTPKPFVGFGDSNFKTVGPLSFFNFSGALNLKQDLGFAVQKAEEKFAGHRLNYAEIVKIEIGPDRIEHITLSSGQNLTADHFVFCDSPMKVLNLLPADAMNSRWRSRILKTPMWTRIKIHFHHKQPVCADELLKRPIFLIPGGTTQEPFVGEISCRNGIYSSVWQSYVDEEMGEESELISSTIKHMRRQLQRVFNPEEFRKESLLMVESEATSDFSGLANATSGLEDTINNCVLGSPLFSNFNGLMGCVGQSCQILQNITRPQQKLSKEPSILAEDTASC